YSPALVRWFRDTFGHSRSPARVGNAKRTERIAPMHAANRDVVRWASGRGRSRPVKVSENFSANTRLSGKSWKLSPRGMTCEKIASDGLSHRDAPGGIDESSGLSTAP